MPKAEDRGAIILAGGDSKRLGVAKALLKLEGKTMIERTVSKLSAYFNQITVATCCPELFPNLPVRLTDDLLTGHDKNPLRGIHAGLCAVDLPHQFVIACDMPFINLELISYMEQFAAHYDVVVPRIEKYYQPLYAFYSRICIQPIENMLKQGGGKVTSFYRSVNVKHIDWEEIKFFDPLGLSFTNINSQADYQRAQSLMVLAPRGN